MARSFELFGILVLSLLNLVPSSYSQIGVTELTKIGVIQAKNFGLKIKGTPSSQPIVIKLIPNLKNITNCESIDNALKDYKSLLNRILIPINNSLSIMKSSIQSRDTGVRFWGAVVGGVALGIAASAQITAGIALHNSIQNAAAVNQLKDAIRNSNKAIESLSQATTKTVIAVSALQSEINTKIIPVINTIGCDVAANTFKLELNRYFSEISLIFGPNLRDPSSQTLSIQAISQAFHGDFESMLDQLKYDKSDFLDILQSDSIRGRIIDVNMDDYWISIQIEYPELIKISNSIVQEFNLISYNDKGSEWMTVFPRALLIRGSLISNIDLKDCSRTDLNYICQEDTSSPISPSLYNCAQGQTENCARTSVINSHVSRFALLNGVIFANCIPMSCVCVSKNQALIQDSSASNVMISSDDCKEVQLDGMIITVGPKKLNRTMFSRNVSFGPEVATSPVDVRNQLAKAEESINEAKKHLDNSNRILNRINPAVVNTSTAIFLIIITTVLLIWSIVSIVWLIHLTRAINESHYYSNRASNVSTINSMSSLIPGI